MMKTIRITINENLLTQIDQVIKTEGINRSAFVQQALEEALHRTKIIKLEQQHIAGYLRQPVKSNEFEGWLETQAWGDE